MFFIKTFIQMELFNRLSEKLSLTKTEIKIFFFLSIVLIIGGGYKIIKDSSHTAAADFNYAVQDSLFFSAANREDESDNYKEDVLGNDTTLNYEEKAIPGEKSININTAGLEELSGLPGIGPVIAGNIVAYRISNGKFRSLDQLLNVKGIGPSKFGKIKKYIFIES